MKYTLIILEWKIVLFNPVLWTLDKETSPKTFERLCVDLMYRNGYKDILPLGDNYDRGRDAETELFKGTNDKKRKIFFQFSLEEQWDGKLNRELKKVNNFGHKFDFYIFITSQNVTGYKIDKLRVKTRKQYGWELIIFHREWLRLQLEEANKDLAKKYLEVSSQLISKYSRSSITIN